MFRSIGSVTFLALLMVGCGDVSGAASSPPPPPPIDGYTVEVTVSGLVGSGLSLVACAFVPQPYSHGGSHCDTGYPVSANGEFTLAYSGPYANYEKSVTISQQPASPTQHCVFSNGAANTPVVNGTRLTVSCAAYAYVTSAADNTVSSYSIDATTGALSLIGTAIVAGLSPYTIVGTSNKRFLFVANEDSNDVSAFAADAPNGALTEVRGSPFPAGTHPQAMLVLDAVNVPSSLIVLNAGSDNLSDYALDVTTGALQLPSTVATGKGPTSVVFDPVNGGIVFVANHGGSNDISGFYNFQWLSPVAIPGSPFPAGGNPLSLALGAGGKFLYSANPDANNPSISCFTVDGNTGVWSPVSGSPFPLPVSHYIASDQTGTYLYVTTGSGIVGYAIDATTGALTALPGFPVAAGANAYSISVDPTDQFLYVADEGAAHVSGFELNASTGALTPMAGSPFPAGNHPDFIATF